MFPFKKPAVIASLGARLALAVVVRGGAHPMVRAASVLEIAYCCVRWEQQVCGKSTYLQKGRHAYALQL
jgi:hypothetical protein